MFAAVLAASSDWVYVCDRAGTFLHASAAGARALGREPADLLGKTWRDLGLPPDPMEALDRGREAAFASRRALSGDVPFTTPGGVRPVATTWTPVLGEGGVVVAVVVTVSDPDVPQRPGPAPPGGEPAFRLRAEDDTDLITRDVSEQRRTEKALRLSEARLEAILDNSNAVAYLKDLEGRYVLVNRQYAELFGVTKDGIIGKTDHDIFPRELADAFRANDRKALAAAAPIELEEVAPHPDGLHTYISIKVPLRDTAGAPYAVCGISTDITERKRVEEALRLGEERFRGAFDAAAIGMGMVTPDGRWMRVNRALCEIVGYAEEELLATTFQAITHPDDLDADVGHLHRLLAGEIDAYQTEKRYIHRRGHEVWVRVSASLVRDAAGKPLHLVDLIEDITRRKRAEEALRASEERFRTVAETAHDAIISADGRGQITQFNRGAERIFDIPAGAVIGGPLTVLMPERFREAHLRGFGRFLATGESRLVGTTVDLVGRRADGAEFPMELSASRWATAEGTFVTAIIRDISGRRRAEELLRLQNARLEEGARSERAAHDALKQAQSRLVESAHLASLGQMVAGVAHEFNNPLAFVINNVAVLRRDLAAVRDLLGLYEQAEGVLALADPSLLDRIRLLRQRADLDYTLENLPGLLSRTRDGLGRIRRIVQDLRAFARLDEGELGEADLNAGIESTASIIEGQARRKGVAVERDLRPLPPVTCHAAKLNQVVLNLLGNAVDACAEGGRVTIRTEAEADRVRIEVADTGSGIDPAIRGRIFDPFFTTKPVGEGTGLGLSISYGIVQDHGGTIEVESTPGRGARFAILLPMVPPATDRETPPGRPSAVRTGDPGLGGANEDLGADRWHR